MLPLLLWCTCTFVSSKCTTYDDQLMKNQFEKRKLKLKDNKLYKVTQLYKKNLPTNRVRPKTDLKIKKEISIPLLYRYHSVWAS